MSTESITKEFVIGEEACKRLIKAMKNPAPVPKHILNATDFEDGERILEQYFGRSDK